MAEATEKKYQELSKEQYTKHFGLLPWELGVGFFWGFPATVWAFFAHPIKLFKSIRTGNVRKALLFAVIIRLIARAPDNIGFWYQYFFIDSSVGDIAVKGINATLLDYRIYCLIVGPLSVALMIIYMSVLYAFFAHSLLVLFRQVKFNEIKLTICVAGYMNVSALFSIIPVVGALSAGIIEKILSITGLIYTVNIKPKFGIVVIFIVTILFWLLRDINVLIGYNVDLALFNFYWK